MPEEVPHAYRILLVEDDMIIATDISIHLEKLGYEIVGIATRAEDALILVEANQPDLILMDIMLKGKMDGIEAAMVVLEKHQTPIVFLTSNTDDATFRRALQTKPFAFISKPFQKPELERTLVLTFERLRVEKSSGNKSNESDDHISSMDDRLFIRHKDQLVKVYLKELLFIEADRNYCKIHAISQDFLLSVPMRKVEFQLPNDLFIRVHRSFVVKLKQIDAIHDNHEYLMIQSHQIPISRRMKEDVIKRLKLI